MKLTTEISFFKAVLIDIHGVKETIDDLTKDMNSVDVTNRSTRGKLSRQYIFSNFDSLKELTQKYLYHLKLLYPKNNFELASAWTVYGYEGSYHEFHKHNKTEANSIATITYLEVPNDVAGDLVYIIDKEVYKITPQKGLFCIMPIDLIHGTYPQGKGLRQTLNLDFKLV